MLTGLDDPGLRSRALAAGVTSSHQTRGRRRVCHAGSRLASVQRERVEKSEETKELRERAESADRRINARDREAFEALFRAYEARDPEASRRMRWLRKLLSS